MSRAARLIVILASLVVGACTLAAPLGPVSGRLAQLVAAHRDKALALERSGDVRRALDEWKIALTLDPGNAEAREGRARVTARLEAAVARRLKLGQEALQRSAPVEARRHFLTVLALDPANKTAFAALRDEAGEAAYVVHTVARGETLAEIAQRYYGDRARAEVIWETNRLPANPRLAPGTRLKIPEISGVPMRAADGRPPATVEAARAEPPAGRPESSESPLEELGTTEVNPLLMDTHEALERKEYPIALAAVDRLLEGNPRPEWIDLKKSILYSFGTESLAAGLYDDSYRAFAQLARLDTQYRDTAALLQQARAKAIQAHHSEGIRLYREEHLEAAIAHWRAVLEYDPGHADAKRNIEQAQRILKALQDRLRNP